MILSAQNSSRRYLIILIFWFCGLSLFSQKQSNPLNVTIATNLGDTLTVLDVLNKIEAEGVLLGYTNKLNLKNTIVLEKNAYTTKELLTLVIRNTNLRIHVIKDKVLLVRKKKKPSDYMLISGFVRESSSKEILIGSTVYLSNLNKGTVTNNYGFYSLKLKKADYTLVASYLGFQNQSIQLSQDNDTVYHDFYLSSDHTNLKEVIVKPQTSKLQYHAKGYEKISKTEIDNATNLFGENDFIKALHSKVGVVGSAQGAGSFNVRGGNSGHNLILIDGISVYNYNHLGGMLSIFNSQAIKKVGFYRGTFPAEYNGRLSSVIDVRTKDGNMEEFHGDVSWSPMALSTSFEGPIVKEKISFVSSFRRSFIDFFIKDVRLNLYDLNFKVNYIANRSNRFFVSVYSGQDRFKINNGASFLIGDLNLDWGNLLATFKWNHVYGPRLFQQTSLTYSSFKNTIGTKLELNDLEDDYDYIEDMDFEEGFGYAHNKIDDISLKTNCDFFVSEKNKTKFGLELKHVLFNNPFNTIVSDNTVDEYSIKWKERSVHAIAYVDNQIKLKDKIELDLGFNFSSYFVSNKSFFHILPRVSLSYSPVKKGELFVSYSRLSQFQHEITLAIVSLPSELRAPSSEQIPPEISNIIELGGQYQFNDNTLLNVQAYYKKMNGIIRYRLGQDFLNGALAPQLNNRLIIGQRENKGVEVQFVKDMNKLNIETSYALSKSENQFDELNFGKFFPAKLDIRNLLRVSLTMAVNKKLKIFTLWNYSTGQAISVPQQTNTDINDVLGIQSSQNTLSYTYQIQALNQYRLPDNYSLDIGGSYTKKTRRSNTWKYSFGVNNLVGRSAPFIVDSKLNENTNQLELQELSLYRFIPYVGVGFKF